MGKKLPIVEYFFGVKLKLRHQFWTVGLFFHSLDDLFNKPIDGSLHFGQFANGVFGNI